ncbi:uncharacterized protein LOC112043949 [Bicyclus anynana]|uniref:Uncharacterized protein LOC112043949 n=1 Tax=Bicyclus anynana TaxID=110368 RepID=A0A6J1MR67_BICAN|nr:uncharacterized protein LOC112043949 [Bicyclus anynana]
MVAPKPFLLFLVFAALCVSSTCSDEHEESSVRKVELYDGVYVKVPEKSNESRKLVSFEIDTNSNGETETGRGKQKKLMKKILPMFILPFVFQSTLVPLFLGLLKFMLFKSLMIGKLALVLIIINAFKNSNPSKGRHDDDIASLHYGFHGNGMEEFGSYFNS